jgi:ribosomal protein S18 acetylase RimI-like enzyme
MEIRELTISDYPACMVLWSQTPGIGISSADSEDALSRFLLRNPGTSFICIENGALVGTVLCGHDGRRGYIYHLAVAVPFHRQGIGKQLLEHALQKMRQAGMEKCHILVMITNETGMAFWEHAGWKKRSEICSFSKNL